MRKAVFWKILERAGVLGGQFVLQVILARILEPECYGTLAVMLIFIDLANVFIQQGFGTALIQNKDVSEDDYSSVFWTVLVIASVLYGILYFLAPFAETFFDIRDFSDSFRILALMLFPGALNSIQQAKLSRELDYRKIFISNLFGVVISGISGIFVALIALFASFVFAWNCFNWFNYKLELRYEVGLSCLSLVLGYLAFAFTFAALSNNTWIGKGIYNAAKYFYAVPIARIFKSQNGVLYMGTVKVIVAFSLIIASSVVYVPFCLVMSLFALFGWGVSARRLKEELVSLKATLM